MNESISVYDVLDENNNILNSQVLIDNIGFEIPSDYYFNKEATSTREHILHIMNENNYIRLYYEKCDENNYKLEISNIRKKHKITEEFINYRGQKIIEYENETGINIISFDNTYVVVLNSKCKKYSTQYYILYYILFSFTFECLSGYDNLYFQKNNYCIMKNGLHLYEKYNKNIIKYNPIEILNKYTTVSFCDYLNNNVSYDEQIENYYTLQENNYLNIVNKIDSYINFENDDPNLMDLIEE